MKADSNTTVIVACVGFALHRPLREQISAQNWDILEGMTPREMLRGIRCLRTKVAVVPLLPMVPDGVQLVNLLCGPPGGIAVIAVALLHSDRCERDARAAGAGCYIPVVGDFSPVIQAVNSVLEIDGSISTARIRMRPMSIGVRMSSSFPPLVNPGRRA